MLTAGRLVLLVGQHAAGSLAARGRQALVALSPTWSGARGYRTGKAAGTAVAVAAALLLAVAALAVGSVVALTVPQREASWVLPSLTVLWGAGILTHPAVAAILRQLPVTRRSAAYQALA